ncbi:thermonuclease family protein [Alkalicoccus luteus]|uniref:Thermonuclease family protein n=1 Tax=Alkalicoccus luteus TaxID=1237094 RepID=A0A969PT88_9BACI|nr:thermonuclease family protein [Alkalicoccus luteus]NJP37488.1 thermonuclease family protein [Alkalicoccus luteus]
MKRLLVLVWFLTACGINTEEETFELEFELHTYVDRIEQGDIREGTVTHVVDGDTFDVVIAGEGEERIRPYMVDAPEICHGHDPPTCESEPWGDEAAIFARQELLGETVYLEQDETPVDRFDRTLAYVYLEDGTMFQEKLLALGLAEVVVYPPDDKYEADLRAVEEEARERGIRMWE